MFNFFFSKILKKKKSINKKEKKRVRIRTQRKGKVIVTKKNKK